VGCGLPKMSIASSTVVPGHVVLACYSCYSRGPSNIQVKQAVEVAKHTPGPPTHPPLWLLQVGHDPVIQGDHQGVQGWGPQPPEGSLQERWQQMIHSWEPGLSPGAPELPRLT
jgi:hypothetical protein